MKKLYLFFLGLVLIVLVICTLFGESLYNLGKPAVVTGKASTVAGQSEIKIPLDALRSNETGDYVYLLSSEKGYSRIIYTVSRVDVEVTGRMSDAASLAAPCGVGAGDRLVLGDGIFKDGQRVVPER